MLAKLLKLLLLAAITVSLVSMLTRHTHVVSTVAGVFGAQRSSAPTPAFGDLLDPVRGLARNARQADANNEISLEIESLEGEVRIVRDYRGVPHIFADSDRDATIALGYVVAQDRLFQMDFIPRVVSGRLSEIFGEDLLPTDRFMRSTGMLWSARRNLERLLADGDPLINDILTWYSAGANAYIDGLSEAEYPVEFKLLGYAPERRVPLHGLMLMQYMNYDLTYWTDDPSYAAVRDLMNRQEFGKLFPRHSKLAVPILQEDAMEKYRGQTMSPKSVSPDIGRDSVDVTGPQILTETVDSLVSWLPSRGYVSGKGSNNWAVNAERSVTGKPILAGDMHLSLRLPAIWYEAHIVTPTRNEYGVTIPGATSLVEAFNDHLGWTFTNTGSDQIDHYELVLSEDGRQYQFEGTWHDLQYEIDTLKVRGSGLVADTVRLTHWGPILRNTEQPTSIQWIAHKPSNTARAAWEMGKARNLQEFEAALQYWDAPMQNILVATNDGDIAIRSTGYLPVRALGHGVGVLDGTSAASGWTGRVPFDKLPFARNPSSGYLTSTNQEPAGDGYPYYLGHVWDSALRSMRIDSLMRGKVTHSLADITSYQSDVYAVQHQLLKTVLDTLTLPHTRVDSLRHWLLRWDGKTTVDRFEPLILDEFLRIWQDLVWDEFTDTKSPGIHRAFEMMQSEPESQWFDIRDTHLMKETAVDVVRAALSATADTLDSRYGWDRSAWRWGAHHGVRFNHLLQSLSVLGRGPYEYPGFSETLSPAASRVSTHSASWRIVVDFSGEKPAGKGIYPGGQSGNPFSRQYDSQIRPYLEFQLYNLLKPEGPDGLTRKNVLSEITLKPSPHSD